jgi:signal transduction histidine kinase
LNDKYPSQQRDEGLAFLGSMIAGQSHEVTNVLNIISELSGLQVDLLIGATRGRQLNLERLSEIAERIKFQVHRGETIVRKINSFAHSVDLPVAVFDLKETMERVIFLAARPARLSKIEIVSEFPEESVAIENNPFLVQHATFICINIGLRAASEKRRVSVSYCIHEDGAEILVSSADPLVMTAWMAEKLEFLGLLIRELGGAMLETPGAENNSRLAFSAAMHVT